MHDRPWRADDNVAGALAVLTSGSLVLEVQGVVIEISAPPAIGSMVRTLMGDAASVRDPKQPPALRYTHEIRPDGTHRFIRRDGMVTTGVDPQGAVDAFTDHLHTAVANRATTGLFVHAGAFSIDNRLVLVPGPSHSGKSSLVVAAVRRGAIYFSDEFAVIDDAGCGHPYPRPLSVRTPRGPRRLHPNTDLGGTVAAGPSPVAVILDTRFEQGTSWRPTPVEGARGALPIIANTIHARRQAESTIRVAARLARDALVLAGPRGEAEPMLDELVEILRSLPPRESERSLKGTA